jgi:hypothetical protein
MSEVEKIAAGLTEAQRAYLLALEPNSIAINAPSWIQEVERDFQNRTHKKPIGGRSLASAGVLVRKGVIAACPEPCECGWHYASITPLGLAVRRHLQEQANVR